MKTGNIVVPENILDTLLTEDDAWVTKVEFEDVAVYCKISQKNILVYSNCDKGFLHVGNVPYGQTFEFTNDILVDVEFPVYWKGELDGETYMVKIRTPDQLEFTSYAEYLRGLDAIKDSTVNTQAADFIEKYPLLGEFLNNTRFNGSFSSSCDQYKVDVEGRTLVEYTHHELESFQFFIPSELKKELRIDILSMAKTIGDKKFWLGGYGDLMVGYEKWELEMEGGIKLEIHWSEELPAGTAQYHDCDIVRNERTSVDYSLSCKIS